jgi:pyocin large subunit-like protein
MILRRYASGWGGLPWRRVLTAMLAAAAILVYWTQLGERGQRADARDVPAAADSRDTAVKARANIGFATERRLEEHYDKHGAEFGRLTKQDYLRQAQLLRDAQVGGPVLQTVRADGVTTKFDRQTGAFIAFNPNGTIRTFFKPNDGERYYRRQAERGAE